MSTHNEHQISTDRQDGPVASLTVELRSEERRRLAVFRESFLKWVADRSGGTLALGAPDSLSLEEVPSGPDGLPMLRMDMSWRAPEPGSALVPSTAPPGGPLQSAMEHADPVEPTSLCLADDFQFFPDPSQLAPPVYRELSPSVHPDTLAPIGTRHDGLPTLVPVESLAARQFRRLVDHARTLLRALPPALRSVNLHFSVFNPDDVHFRHAAAAVATLVLVLGGAAYLMMAGPAGKKAPVQTVATADVPVRAAVPPPDTTTHVVDAPAPASAPKAPIGTSGAERAAKSDAPVKSVDKAAGAEVVRGTEAVSTDSASRSSVRGALRVTSDPVGAQVSINGVPHGRTPLTIRGLQAGSRVLRLDLAGYERWSWGVSVVANRQTPVMVKLHPEPRKTSSPD